MMDLIRDMVVLGVVVCTAVGRAAGALPAEVWRMTELTFESERSTGADVEADVVFSCEGRQLRIPAFWDGGRTYRVRFAPPSAGMWTWCSKCGTDKALDGKCGEIEVRPYSGNLEIYRRGFVCTKPGLKHFIYADGTPFFYLGDTHWGFGREIQDDMTNAAAHHVETVVRRRVEQRFTVWQSEPIGCTFDLTDGTVDETDIPGLRALDRAFAVVADAGMVHANAQFFFPTQLKEPLASDTNALRRLSRQWVARYGAFPVMWTLGQEVDNDMYYPKQNKVWSARTNPYVAIARFMHSFDAYGHPLTAHQENSWNTTVTGAGATDGGRSLFADPSLAAECGHNWWGVQWSPALNGGQRVDMLRDYWNDRRVAVNYEGRYCGLWTMDFGARAQAWISFLSGFRGYGYGAADLWLFRSTYEMDKPSKDEVETVSVKAKHTPWRKALEFPSAVQMRYFRDCMERFAWWRLEPDFGEGRSFRPDVMLNGAYVAAADGDVLAMAYVFGKQNRSAGSFARLSPNMRYAVERFNPRNGVRSELGIEAADDAGTLSVGARPDCEDWVYIVTKVDNITRKENN